MQEQGLGEVRDFLLFSGYPGLSCASTTDKIERYRSKKSFISLICEISVNLWLKVLFATD